MHRRFRRSQRFTLAVVALLWCHLDAGLAIAQQLLPDLVPWVREDAPYLVNWDISSGNLRMQTMFANIGDGLLQLRTDLAGTGGSTTPLTQRVFIGLDNGPNYQDFFVENVLNFHQAHGHIHFDNFSEFQLRQVLMDAAGVVTVGNLIADTVKTSYRISDTARIPDPLYASKVSYPSSNTGLYQNISAGFGDIYSHGTEGQSISLTGVPLGPKYWLRQIVDPTNILHEKNEANNSFEIMIDLSRPGKAELHLDGSFVRPGDVMPLPPGDLTGDRLVDIQDWLTLQANASASLVGITDAEAIARGDLNLDRIHSLTDVRLFRQFYDAVHGAGSSASLALIPEPSTLTFALCVAAGCTLATLRGCRFSGCSRMIVALVLAGAYVAAPVQADANTVLFSENFDGLTLGPNVDETVTNSHAWTQTPPSGWTVDDSGVPFVADSSRGVAEWEGWSFANKDWWVSAAGDQQRAEFTLGQGTVAVADPDEWDDKGYPINGSPFAGYYNAVFRTPAIALSGATANSVKLAFSSSWRDECCDDGPTQSNNQTARIRVSYNNGASFGEALHWESNPASPNFKNDATNEAVVVNLNNPAGASSVIVEFGLLNAGNDWWWAIDNVQLFTPMILEVDTTSGQMTLIGASQLAGYEITSGAHSLDAGGWRAGNLDAQNYGPANTLNADFNNSNSVDAADYVRWRKALGATNGGDANGDGVTDQQDYSVWRQQFATNLAPGQSWETLLADDRQLLEFYLLGDSTFASHSIGRGYNTAVDARDLTFTYSLSNGQEYNGLVRYVSGTVRSSALVPEVPAPLLCMSGLIYFSRWDRAARRVNRCL